MKFTVYFKPNTESDYAARLIVNVPFLRLYPKSVAVRITHSSPEMKTIYRAEIFVPDRLVSEIPKLFVGELKMLSPQIVSVQRAS